MLVVNHRIRIPLSEFEFSYARSSGPGGQNVNKVSSKAQLRWPVLSSPSLPPDVRARLISRFSSRITTEGELLIVSQRYRDQQRNTADCLDKLAGLLRSVASAPKTRRPTRPSRGSVERRLQSKQQQARKKQDRRRLDD